MYLLYQYGALLLTLLYEWSSSYFTWVIWLLYLLEFFFWIPSVTNTVFFNLPQELNKCSSSSGSWRYLGQKLSCYFLWKLFFRFVILVLSLNITIASNCCNFMRYFSNFIDFTNLFKWWSFFSLLLSFRYNRLAFSFILLVMSLFHLLFV